jgi:NAD(P)-dependent dehydrogenase (short-subunit alcohol dehydrogenase family)
LAGAALVTGAASGIGRAVADRFVECGACVVAVDWDGDALAALERELPATSVLCVEADVRSLDRLERAVREGKERFGGVNIVAAIAGVARYGRVGAMDDAERDLVFDVNVIGVWNAVRAALPALIESPHPRRVIACGSIESVLGGASVAAYTASKHAVVGLVKALAVELAADDITVNAVSPAGIDTPMLRAALERIGLDRYLALCPSGRLAPPSEVADVVAFLASAASRHVSGTNVMVDGAASVVNPRLIDLDEDDPTHPHRG